MSANVAIALIVGMFIGGIIVLLLFSAILIYSEHKDDDVIFSDKDTVEEVKKNELP